MPRRNFFLVFVSASSGLGRNCQLFRAWAGRAVEKTKMRSLRDHNIPVIWLKHVETDAAAAAGDDDDDDSKNKHM